MLYPVYSHDLTIIEVSNEDIKQLYNDNKLIVSNSEYTNYNTGLYYYIIDQINTCIEYFSKTNDNIYAMTLLGEYYLKIKEYKNAKKYLLIGVSKGYEKAKFKLSYYYLNTDKFDKAKKILKEIVKANNSYSIDAMLLLGNYYYNNNNIDGAIKYFKMSIDKDINKSIDALIILGKYYLKNEKTVEEGEKYLLQAIEIDINKSNDILVLLGKHLIKSIRIEKFLKGYNLLEKAIDRGNIEAMIEYSQILISKHNYKPAIEGYLLTAIDKNIRKDYCMFLLGKYYLSKDDNYNAIKYFTDAMINGSPYAQNQLAKLITPLELFTICQKNNINYKHDITKEVRILMNKLANFSKTANCDICMEEQEKILVLLNCCAHHICQDCYLKLYNKPCPYCRL